MPEVVYFKKAISGKMDQGVHSEAPGAAQFACRGAPSQPVLVAIPVVPHVFPLVGKNPASENVIP
jgi:hypothetical protein